MDLQLNDTCTVRQREDFSQLIINSTEANQAPWNYTSDSKNIFNTNNGAVLINATSYNTGTGVITYGEPALVSFNDNYPVSLGIRKGPETSTTATAAKMTLSSYTARRQTNFNSTELISTRIGSDISFEVEDSSGIVYELGSVGSVVSGTGQLANTLASDLVFSTYRSGFQLSGTANQRMIIDATGVVKTLVGFVPPSFSGTAAAGTASGLVRGMIIFNTTSGAWCGYDGTAWQQFMTTAI